MRRSFFFGLTFTIGLFASAACEDTPGAEDLSGQNARYADAALSDGDGGEAASSGGSSGTSGSSSSASTSGAPSSSSGSTASSTGGSSSSASSTGGPDALNLTSTAFVDGAKLPCAHVPAYCGGNQLSPPFAWNAGPSGTLSYALVMKNPDAPAAEAVHWVLYDIPPAVLELAVDVARGDRTPNPPAGSKQSQPPPSFGDSTFGYFGPCPNPTPAGGNTVTGTYTFTLYARASAVLEGATASTSSQDLATMVAEGAIAESTLTGRQNAGVGACTN